jgi:hypothetical protein
MLRRIYDWTISLAGVCRAEKAPVNACFIENNPDRPFTLLLLLLGGFYLVKVIL